MDIALAIHRINPRAEYRLTDDRAAILEWRGPGPQPTPAALDAAWTAYQSERQQAAQAEATRLADLSAARSLVLTTAAGAVGVRFDALTTTQLRSLLAIVLWQGGALDATGVVRPLAQWVRSPQEV